MDLNSLHANNLGAATSLTIMFTDTDLAAFTGELMTEIGGTMSGGGSLSYGVWVDAGNTPFALTTPVLAIGPLTSGAFSGSDSGAVSLDAPFSLTQRIVVSGSTGPRTVSYNAEVRPVDVPEPTSLLLIGGGLIGLALRRRQI
jgi:hypothetical protein